MRSTALLVAATAIARLGSSLGLEVDLFYSSSDQACAQARIVRVTNTSFCEPAECIQGKTTTCVDDYKLVLEKNFAGVPILELAGHGNQDCSELVNTNYYPVDGESTAIENSQVKSIEKAENGYLVVLYQGDAFNHQVVDPAGGSLCIPYENGSAKLTILSQQASGNPDTSVEDGSGGESPSEASTETEAPFFTHGASGSSEGDVVVETDAGGSIHASSNDQGSKSSQGSISGSDSEPLDMPVETVLQIESFFAATDGTCGKARVIRVLNTTFCKEELCVDGKNASCVQEFEPSLTQALAEHPWVELATFGDQHCTQLIHSSYYPIDGESIAVEGSQVNSVNKTEDGFIVVLYQGDALNHQVVQPDADPVCIPYEMGSAMVTIENVAAGSGLSEDTGAPNGSSTPSDSTTSGPESSSDSASDDELVHSTPAPTEMNTDQDSSTESPTPSASEHHHLPSETPAPSEHHQHHHQPTESPAPSVAEHHHQPSETPAPSTSEHNQNMSPSETPQATEHHHHNVESPSPSPTEHLHTSAPSTDNTHHHHTTTPAPTLDQEPNQPADNQNHSESPSPPSSISMPLSVSWVTLMLVSLCVSFIE